MTYAEARKEIIENGVALGAEDFVDTEALMVAVDACDRLTPEKPEMRAMQGFDPEVASELCCPHCLGPVTNYWVRGAKPKHCQFCGQAIDWGEEDQKHAK